MNTHDYDKRLTETIHRIREYPSTKTFDESIKYIINITNSINYSRKSEVMRTIHLFTMDRKNNFDPINNISVDELLPRLIEHIDKWEDKFIVLEQLADVSSHGSCPQGRCTRLVQLF